ncbi:MAG: glutaredoxin family protein [Halodesulfurarchaeum sp.]
MSITLYALEGCPYCEAVMDELEEAGVEYDVVWVDPLHSERDEVKRVSNQRSVPVLEDTDRSVVMAEPSAIEEYVRTTLA